MYDMAIWSILLTFYIYDMAIWSILLTFVIFYGHLVYFYPLHKEKSGNPVGANPEATRSSIYSKFGVLKLLRGPLKTDCAEIIAVLQ
jgi:hypothetical protein